MLARVNYDLIKANKSWADLDSSYFRNPYTAMIDNNVVANAIDMLVKDELTRDESKFRRLLIIFVGEILDF
jgi:hypothetical protein